MADGNEHVCGDPLGTVEGKECPICLLYDEVKRLRRIMANRLGGMVVSPHAFVCPVCGWDEKSQLRYVKHIVEEHGSLVTT